MSVVDQRNFKILLPRLDLPQIWRMLLDEYFGSTESDPVCRKRLAMLALHENAGWPMEEIGRLFNHDRGHVSRSLQAIKKQIRQRFHDPEAIPREDVHKDHLTQSPQSEDAEAAKENEPVECGISRP